MISQTNQTVKFFFAFTKAKSFYAPSATPTVNVGRTGSSSYVVQNGAPTPFPNFPGIYYYALAAASTANPDDYLAVATTTDTTPDMMQVPSFWAVGNSFAQAVPSVAPDSPLGLPTTRGMAELRAGTQGTVWFVSTAGSDGNSGQSWSAAFATPAKACAVATAGDVIRLGPGTFALSAAISFPDGVCARGAGLDVTIIDGSAVPLNSVKGVAVRPPSAATLSDLTILGSTSPGTFTGPLGYWSGLQTPPADAVIERVRLTGWSDGFYCRTKAGDLANFRFRDCIFDTNYDCMTVQANGQADFGTVNIDAIDCLFLAAGLAGRTEEARGIVHVANGLVRIYGGRIDVTHAGSGPAIGITTVLGGSPTANAPVVRAYATEIYTKSSQPNNDLWVDLAGSITVTDCTYDPTTVIGATVRQPEARDVIQGVNATQIGGFAAPAAAPGAAGGLLINGANTGPISFSGGMQITNSAGDALDLVSTGNGAGLSASGNSLGAGIIARGGSSASGLVAFGGSVSGSGIFAQTNGGPGLALESNGGPAILAAVQSGAFDGISVQGGTGADGIHAAAGTGGTDIVGNLSGLIGSAAVAQIAAALAGQSMIVVSPVAKGAITITQGAAYREAYGNPLDFTPPTNGNWPADFTGWTLSIAIAKAAGNPYVGQAGQTLPMSIVTASGSGQKIRLELSSAQTAALAVAQGAGAYAFDLWGVPSGAAAGDKVNLLTGTLTVSP